MKTRTEAVGFNRDTHRTFLKKARRELKTARARGYSDDQILDALKSGGPEHQQYAKYIEFFILKPEKVLPSKADDAPSAD